MRHSRSWDTFLIEEHELIERAMAGSPPPGGLAGEMKSAPVSAKRGRL